MKTLSAPSNLEQCRAFLDTQFLPRPGRVSPAEVAPTFRAVTISRQAGCGAFVIAERLAQLLQARDKCTAAPWTVFDRNLIEQVLADHNLPLRLAKFLPEDRGSEIQDALDELFGLHPSTWTVVEQTAETILRLSQLGHVILIGRGAHLITAKLPGVFHVRLVAAVADRAEHAHRFYALGRPEAREFIAHEDHGRRRYLKKYFGADVDDPLHYHLTINTSKLSYEAAAQLILGAATAMPHQS